MRIQRNSIRFQSLKYSQSSTKCQSKQIRSISISELVERIHQPGIIDAVIWHAYEHNYVSTLDLCYRQHQINTHAGDRHTGRQTRNGKNIRLCSWESYSSSDSFLDYEMISLREREEETSNFGLLNLEKCLLKMRDCGLFYTAHVCTHRFYLPTRQWKISSKCNCRALLARSSCILVECQSNKF